MNPMQYAVLELTNRCNLRCVHCASNSGPPRDREYDTGEWIHIVEGIAALGGREITLIGGELLLHPGWEEIAWAVKQHGMRLVLISNGLLVDDVVFQKWVHLDPYIIGISLDGATRETVRAMRRVDGFDKAFGLLGRLVATGHPRVNAITTFCRLNFHEFDRIADLLRGTGITWQVQVANPTGERFSEDLSLCVEEFSLFCEKVTHILHHDPELFICPMDDFGYHPLDGDLPHIHEAFPGCMAGISVVGIRSDGAVLPCLSLGDEFVCGNLHEASLMEIWQDNDRFERFRNKRKYLTGVCAACAHADTCRGGCTAMAAGNTGSFGENHFCLRAIGTRLVQEAMGLPGE